MSATGADIDLLRETLQMYICPGVPWDDRNPLKRALDAAGIRGWAYDFIPCHESYLQDLYDPDPGPGLPPERISVNIIQRLIQLQQFYHFVSYQMVADADLTLLGDDSFFRQFLLAEYDSQNRIGPWRLRRSRERRDLLRDTKRSLQRPNPQNFPNIKEDKHYAKWLIEFSQNLEQAGLAHCVDSTFAPEDNEIFGVERAAVMRILMKVIQLPRSRQELEKHIAKNDTQQAWQAALRTMSQSMSAKLAAHYTLHCLYYCLLCCCCQ